MKRIYIFIIFNFLTPSVSKAQLDAVNALTARSLSELEQNFGKDPNFDNAQMLSNGYLELAAAVYKRKHQDSLPFFFQKSQSVWQRVVPQNAKAKAQSFMVIGDFYLDVKNYVLADSFFTKASEWALQTDEAEYQCSVQMEWAYVKTVRGLMQEAANLVNRWQDKIESFSNPLIKKQAFQRVGAFYNAYGTPEKAKLAVPYLKRGVEIAEAYLGPNHPRLVFNLGILRTTYKITGDLDSVILIGKKLETLLPQLDIFAQIWVLMTNGSDYLRIHDLPHAKAYLNRTWTLIEANNMQESDDGQYTLYLFGKLAIEEGRYGEAENYLKQALSICKKIDYKTGIQDVLTQLVIVAEKQGKYAEQAHYQKELSALEVAIAKENYANSMAKMEVQLKVVQKDHEINKQKSAQQLLWIGLLLMGFIAALSLWFYVRLRKQQHELAEKNSLIDQQNKELTHLDEAKTRFFANVSHELRTPLTLILGPLSNLLKTNELSNKQFTLLSLARQNVKDLLGLVNEILDLNKLEAAKMTLNAEPTVFYTLMRRLVAAFESHSEQQNIKFTFDYQPDRYLQIELDGNKFEKIINNLLSNALKFTQKGGAIVVSVFEKPNALEIQVKDTGRGIHPDDLPHVFNRFYQSNQADAPTEGGTGIGLSLSMEFAKLMKGKLWVESTFGQGSTFFFSFPKLEVLGTAGELGIANYELGMEDPSVFSSKTDQTSATNNQLPITNNQKTILVVEDNRSLREYLRFILQDNYTVLTAENGLVALDILSKDGTDTPSVSLIISDIMMPEMDGFQLLEVLKSRTYFQQIPVIMLTARADIQDKLKALRIGVDDYLLKPFEEEELFARVHNLLTNSALRQSFRAELLENAVYTEGSVSELGIRNYELGQESRETAWLLDLETVVQKHIGDFDLTADAIADYLAMSRAQFFRRLKTATGLTPNQYLLEVKFNHARQLLEQRKETSVKAAAYSVGMRDVKYFSQQFKERFGKLPSEYLS